MTKFLVTWAALLVTALLAGVIVGGLAWCASNAPAWVFVVALWLGSTALIAWMVTE